MRSASASEAATPSDHTETALTGRQPLTSRTMRKATQKVSRCAIAGLGFICFMGAPHYACAQADLPTPDVTLTSSPNPSKVGESVTFTATVSSPGGRTPQGSITISEPLPGNQEPIIYGSKDLDNGVAVVATDNLTEGTHTIWVTYGGEPGVYKGAQTSVTQVVNEVADLSAEPLKTVIPVHLDALTGGITVGSKTYEDTNGGMHLLAFYRLPDPQHLDMPDVIADVTVRDASSANEFLQNALADAPDVFLVVNAPANYGFPLNAIAKNLERFGAEDDINSVANAISFVLLGNGGRNMGQALQMGSSTRNVDGYLAADSNNKYTFIQPDYVRYDITTDGTIKIGATTYTSAGSYRTNGCDGSNAFHLVVVSREAPDSLIANNSYCTAQSDAQIKNFVTDLKGVVGHEDELVFIASNGHPIPANWNFGTDGDARIYPLAKEIAELGGYFETMVYLTPKDTYSLVGAAAPPIGTADAESRARESSSVYPDHPTGELHGVLARRLRGDWYSPLDADPTGLANLDFYKILAQPPVPFPLLDSKELAAFKSISKDLCGPGCNVRNQYANTNASIASYYSTLLTRGDPVYGDCSKNPATPFCIVRQQLLTEFQYVENIRNFNDNLTTLWSTSGTVTIFSLLNVSNIITAQLPKLKPSASVPNLVEPIVSFFLGLASELPVVGRVAGIADTAFNFAMSLTTDEEGNEAASLTSTVAQVAQQAGDQFTAQGTTIGTQFDFIYQDWGKIQALGTLLANAQKGSAWYWDASTTPQLLQAMRPDIEESYYRSLMPAVYVIGSYLPQCYLCLDYPNNVNWGGKPLYRQPRSYTAYDPDCGVCGGPGAFPKVEPFALNYPPYTFPTDPDNPYEDPSNGNYTQGTPTLLADYSWLAAAPNTDPADGGYYGLYDPGRTLVALLPHLFTPRSQKGPDGQYGLGVYRPAFFESWPFPHIVCGWSDNGSGNPGPGCNWGAAAPSPDAVPAPVTSVFIGTGISKEKSFATEETQVPLTIINSGTLEIRSIHIDKISLRTLAGSGEAVLVDPLLPMKLGTLAPGNSATLNLTLIVPPGVRKLAVSEEVTAAHSNGAPPSKYTYGEVVFPGKQK